MLNTIKQGFHNTLIDISLNDLYPTKNISNQVKQSKKYLQIFCSIQETGLIEAPVVAPFKNGQGYLLLDGHLRIMALKDLMKKSVLCLVSKDDETYTYNKYINRLSAIQEHRMILKVLKTGVSEEKIARTLNLDMDTVKSKITLLNGICPQVVELLKDKSIPRNVFRVLKKMKAPRQVAAAMLMNDQNKFTSTYAQALLDATPQDQLENKGKPKKETPWILARQVRLEEESLSLTQDIAAIKDSYGSTILDITSVQAYLKRLIDNETVAEYLRKFHEPIYEKFIEIATFDFFKFKGV